MGVVDAGEARVAVLEVNQVGDVVHQGMEHVALVGQLGLGALPLGNVDYEAFQDRRIVVAGWNVSALLPNPFFRPGRRMDAIGDLEGPVGCHGSLNVVPDALPVVRMDQLGVGNVIIANQVAGGIAGQLEGAVADELHRPFRVVAAPVGHAGQVAHQGSEGSLAFLERLLGLPVLGDVGDDAIEPEDPTGRIAARLDAVAHPAAAAVGTEDAVLLLNGFSLPQPGQGFFKEVFVLRGDDASPMVQAGQKKVRRSAGDAARSPAKKSRRSSGRSDRSRRSRGNLKRRSSPAATPLPCGSAGRSPRAARGHRAP